MSRRLTQAEIDELLLAVPITQEEVAQRSKLTKLGKSIINMGDKLRVAVINKLDTLRNAHKKRQAVMKNKQLTTFRPRIIKRTEREEAADYSVNEVIEAFRALAGDPKNWLTKEQMEELLRSTEEDLDKDKDKNQTDGREM